MLKTKVKASSITNLTDARYFAAWEAEWIGFDFNAGSEKNIPVQNIIAIKEWVDGVKIVGEFGAIHTTEDIRTAMDLVGLDAVQLGMFVELETMIGLEGVSVIKEFVVEKSTKEEEILEHLTHFSPYTEIFLLDFAKSGHTWVDLKESENISIEFLKDLCQNYQVVISLDFSGEDVEEFLEEIFPYGINIKGGAEEKVGFKSFDDIDDVFEALEIFV